MGACTSMVEEYKSITVKELDLDRFMGKWYVIASIPTWFETSATNAVEVYEKIDEKTIHVSFTYRDKEPSGPLKEMTQTAYIMDEETKAYWKIRPFWPLLFDYLVIDLDEENYQYTTIGRPGKQNLWIMARKPEISEGLLESLIHKAVKEGYRKESILKVRQEW